MQYYTFELNKGSQDLCIISTPFGKNKYKCLPMGLKCNLDFAQQIMEEVPCGLDNVKIYLGNIGIFANIWEELLLLHDKVASCLNSIK